MILRDIYGYWINVFYNLSGWLLWCLYVYLKSFIHLIVILNIRNFVF